MQNDVICEERQRVCLLILWADAVFAVYAVVLSVLAANNSEFSNKRGVWEICRAVCGSQHQASS